MTKSRKLMGYKWKLRWCSITPRYSYPSLPPSHQQVTLQLNCYASQQSQETKFRLSLQGVKAEVKQVHGETHIHLRLPPDQAGPYNLVSKGDARYGVVLFFKAYDNSYQATEYINALASVINQQYVTLPNATDVPSELLPRSRSFDAAMEAIVRNESMQSIHQRDGSLQVSMPEEPSAPAQTQEIQVSISGGSLEPSAPDQTQEIQVSISGGSLEPSAPDQTQEIQVSVSGGSLEQQITEEEACVVCLSNPRVAGFVHDDTVHKCVCNECVSFFQVGAACPVCRQPIEVVLRRFYE
eukprot:TRINITY_DN227_c0_g2_i5.p1 TRINITY_DN227_c0_g2~~TRINITY_DN227_c0_g2_i5.p1  ORF type:complete len:296 (+),score=19.92 TRINITY_DN227_c0_g2_i5:279-1166(+)